MEAVVLVETQVAIEEMWGLEGREEGEEEVEQSKEVERKMGREMDEKVEKDEVGGGRKREMTNQQFCQRITAFSTDEA